MPTQLDANGLQIATKEERIISLTNTFKNIFGQDVDLGSNTQFGQLINILVQGFLDNSTILLRIFNSFDPDLAEGVQLDSRAQLFGIQREGGTFSQIQVNITTDQSITLFGLDADADNIEGTGYTIKDNSGDEYILLNTRVFSAGTTLVTFRARNFGAFKPAPNTITTPVSIVLGVVNVNNPTSSLVIGTEEEEDVDLKIRMIRSVSIASQGYLNGLEGALLNIKNVTSVNVLENNTGTTDSNGIPSHSGWFIVEGGSDADIANTIYSKFTGGAGMKGNIAVNIITISNNIFVSKFDRPISSNLYIKFDIKHFDATTTFNLVAIKTYIESNILYKIAQSAETGRLTEIAIGAIMAQGGKATVLALKISIDNITFVDFLPTQTPQHKWVTQSSLISISEI